MSLRIFVLSIVVYFLAPVAFGKTGPGCYMTWSPDGTPGSTICISKALKVGDKKLRVAVVSNYDGSVHFCKSPQKVKVDGDTTTYYFGSKPKDQLVFTIGYELENGHQDGPLKIWGFRSHYRTLGEIDTISLLRDLPETKACKESK